MASSSIVKRHMVLFQISKLLDFYYKDIIVGVFGEIFQDFLSLTTNATFCIILLPFFLVQKLISKGYELRMRIFLRNSPWNFQILHFSTSCGCHYIISFGIPKTPWEKGVNLKQLFFNLANFSKFWYLTKTSSDTWRNLIKIKFNLSKLQRTHSSQSSSIPCRAGN